MSFFDLFRRKGKGATPAPEPEPEPEPELLPATIVVLREGMSTPSEDDMSALVEQAAPELAGVPRRGLAQPRWWKKEEWVESGLRGVASAVGADLGLDPHQATWRVVTDPRGFRVAIVILRKPRGEPA